MPKRVPTENMLAYHREWQKQNPEKVLEYKKAYRERNREKLLQQAKDYRSRNLEARLAYGAAYREKNRDRLRAEQKAYYRDNKDKHRAGRRKSHLKKKYGLTEHEFEQMVVRQNNACAICKRELESGRKLHIDHCHTTGKVRGLLCYSCNSGLGSFNDDVGRMASAIDYIIEWKKLMPQEA